MQVRDQGGQGAINERETLVFERREIIGVRIPLSAGENRDKGDARFDQATCQQASLTSRCAAIAFPCGLGFPPQIEGVLSTGARHDLERLVRKLVEIGEFRRAIGVAAQVVQMPQQPFAILQTSHAHAAGKLQVSHGIPG